MKRSRIASRGWRASAEAEDHSDPFDAKREGRVVAAGPAQAIVVVAAAAAEAPAAVEEVSPEAAWYDLMLGAQTVQMMSSCA